MDENIDKKARNITQANPGGPGRLVRVRGVLVFTLCLNILISLMKLAAGYIFNAVSMVADGFHSLFDGLSNIIGLIGIKIACMPPDESHPYGHRKYETFAALGVAVLLFISCVEILKSALARLAGGGGPVEATVLGVSVMLVSIAVNVFVSGYETKKGREFKSDFLIADAGHTRSDIFASASVLISLLAARLGHAWADPVAAVIIAAMIGRVGYRIMKTSSAVLCDASVVSPDEIIAICREVPGVTRCHKVRSRGSEAAISVDLRIHVDPNLTAAEAHEIAHEVEDRIKEAISDVTDVVVHVEPDE